MASDDDQPERSAPVLEYQPWYAAPDRRRLRKVRCGLLSLTCLVIALLFVCAGGLWQWTAALACCTMFASFAGALAAVLGMDVDEHSLPAILGLLLNVGLLLSGCLGYLYGFAR